MKTKTNPGTSGLKRIFFLLAAALLTAAPGFLMATNRGLVSKGVPGGGYIDAIVVTSVAGIIEPDLMPGDVISNLELQQFNTGNYVSFEMDPNGMPYDIQFLAQGTVVTGSQNGNIIIGANQAYLVQSTGSISGNISVNGGVLVVMGGSVNGNISIGSNSAIICRDNATVSGGSFKITGGGANSSLMIGGSAVNGQFSSTGLSYLKLAGNMQNGNVKSQGDGMVTITGNTINGNLTVSGVTGSSCIADNIVTGSVSFPPNPCSPGQRIGYEGAARVMEIYPNPASQQVTINVENYDGSVKLQVVNVLGQRVFDKNIVLSGEETYTIDISSLAKGMYKIILLNGYDMGTGTMIKD